MGEEFLKANDPSLYGLFDLLRSLLQARTKDSVIKALEDSQESITIENLLLTSELCYQLSARGEKLGYDFLNHIFELLRTILVVSHNNAEDIKTVIMALTADTFHPNSRIEQVKYQASVDYIVTYSKKINLNKIDSIIFGHLAVWSISGRPNLIESSEEMFVLLNQVASQGTKGLLKSKGVSKTDALLAVSRAFIKTGGPKHLAKLTINIIIVFSIILGFFLVPFLVYKYLVNLPDSLGLWKNIISVLSFLIVGFVLSLTVAIIRFSVLKTMKVDGITIGSGKSAKAFIMPNLSPSKTRKALRHELMHLGKEQGAIKRDLASLYEALVDWEQHTLDDDSRSIFQKGFEKNIDQHQICAEIENYLNQFDSAEGEAFNDYTMGYYILGLIVKLCREDPDGVRSFVRDIFHGRSAEYAFQHMHH